MASEQVNPTQAHALQCQCFCGFLYPEKPSETVINVHIASEGHREAMANLGGSSVSGTRARPGAQAAAGESSSSDLDKDLETLFAGVATKRDGEWICDGCQKVFSGKQGHSKFSVEGYIKSKKHQKAVEKSNMAETSAIQPTPGFHGHNADHFLDDTSSPSSKKPRLTHPQVEPNGAPSDF